MLLEVSVYGRFIRLLALTVGNLNPVSSSGCSVTFSISSIFWLVSGEAGFRVHLSVSFYSGLVVRRVCHFRLFFYSIWSIALTSRISVIWKTSLVSSIESKPLTLSISYEWVCHFGFPTRTVTEGCTFL